MLQTEAPGPWYVEQVQELLTLPPPLRHTYAGAHVALLDQFLLELYFPAVLFVEGQLGGVYHLHIALKQAADVVKEIVCNVPVCQA